MEKRTSATLDEILGLKYSDEFILRRREWWSCIIGPRKNCFGKYAIVKWSSPPSCHRGTCLDACCLECRNITEVRVNRYKQDW